MVDNTRNSYRKFDPSYYNQNRQEWYNYGQQGQQDPNFRQEMTYVSHQDRGQYGHYDPSYQGYHNQPNDQGSMVYHQHPTDQAGMSYHHPSEPVNIVYGNYQREPLVMNYYSQPRNTMVPNYIKRENQEMNPGILSSNLPYYQNMMYYNGQMGSRVDSKGEGESNDGYRHRNYEYFHNKDLFQPSLSFKEAATAMLTMESNKKMPQPRARASSRGRGGIKNISKLSRGSNDQSDGSYSRHSDSFQSSKASESGHSSKHSETTSHSRHHDHCHSRSGKLSDSTHTQSGSRSSISQNNNQIPFGHYIPVSKLSEIDLNKYRNRGLQQLSQYNLMTQQMQAQAQAHPQGKPQQPSQFTPPAPPSHNNYSYNNINYAAMRNVKEWVPIKKLNPNVLTPSARFFPPTPKALSNIRNDQSMHKMNVVEEINVENELIQNLKKNSVSSASSMMESFQQSFSNKRKRIKNCLVEDCRHVIGEQPKIDVQYSSFDLEGNKTYHLNEILSTLLPYHLFYYDEIQFTPPEDPKYDAIYDQIDNLEERLGSLMEKDHTFVLQSGFPCFKEGVFACNEMASNNNQDSNDTNNTTH